LVSPGPGRSLWQGLGLNYALEPSQAAVSQANNLRWIDGYSVQPMVVLGKLDVFAGWGITRVFRAPTTSFRLRYIRLTRMPLTVRISATTSSSTSRVSRVALSITSDPGFTSTWTCFVPAFAWFLGDKQVDYFVNSGMMFTW